MSSKGSVPTWPRITVGSTAAPTSNPNIRLVPLRSHKNFLLGKLSFQAHVKCIVDLDGVESEDDAPDTSYYQWVTFMFAIQVRGKRTGDHHYDVLSACPRLLCSSCLTKCGEALRVA